jgi:predicted nucleic acid binding AN1-type Zn finger protein
MKRVKQAEKKMKMIFFIQFGSTAASVHTPRQCGKRVTASESCSSTGFERNAADAAYVSNHPDY